MSSSMLICIVTLLTLSAHGDKVKRSCKYEIHALR